MPDLTPEVYVKLLFLAGISCVLVGFSLLVLFYVVGVAIKRHLIILLGLLLCVVCIIVFKEEALTVVLFISLLIAVASLNTRR